MSELCCEYLSVQCIWLYVFIMPRTRFRVNLNVKELFARNRREIWTLSDCNGTPEYCCQPLKTSDFTPDSSKEFLDIQATIMWIHSETRTWHDKNIQRNIILIHFPFNNISLPLHVAQAHQKWFWIDFDQSCKIWQDFFLDAANIICFMFLQTCQISDWWWLISGLSLRIYFLIWICRPVVIWEITKLFFFKFIECFHKAKFFHSVGISTFSTVCNGKDYHFLSSWSKNE